MKSSLLIVDDDEIVLSGLAANLEEMGYRIRTALSGVDAMEAMASAPADLVLTDLVMEGMDGLDLLRRLRETHPAVPVIIITGHGTASSALDAVRHGAADYIQKPARSSDIADRVETVLAAQQIKLKLEAERNSSLEREAARDMHTVRSERLATALQFARGLAEELKPMAELIGQLPKAFRDNLSPEQGYQIDRSLSLLNEIEQLGFGLSAKMETLDLNDVVSSALDMSMIRELCDAHPHVTIDTHPADGLPLISGSPSQLRQALASLVSAMMQAFDGGGRLVLSTGAEHQIEPWGHYMQKPTGSYAYILIQSSFRADHESVDRMFEPYTASRCVGRASSGLALTRIVLTMRANGGFIQARPDRNSGMEVKLLFPTVSKAPESGAAASNAAVEPAAGGRRILVVDDAGHHRERAMDLLREMGCSVDEATGGEAAVSMVEKAAAASVPYDVVLLDMVLGEVMDGLDIMRRIHSTCPGQRVVLMGGFADTERIGEARKSGAVDYLRKPLDREPLTRALRVALSG